jgi:hypothetical protein
MAWQLTHGIIPDGLFVLHHCDNPACCRPSHLFLGTAADNSLDMKTKGRSMAGDRNGARKYPERYAKGGNCSFAKLTNEQAQQVRDRYAVGGITQRQLAAEFMANKCTIWHIIHNRTYKLA